MYPTYVVRRAPSHVARRCNPHHGPARHMHGGPGFFGGPQAFFGPLAARQHPFFGPRGGRPTDVFDHFDEFVNRSFEGFFPAERHTRKSNDSTWQPRFDVREVDGAYQLRGEVPGVETSDLEVQFTDANTLVIRGRTASERSEGQQPEAAQQQQSVEDAAAAPAENNTAAPEAPADAEKTADAASVHSESSYVKPSVEDEADATRRESIDSTSTADAPGIATPNSETEAAAAAAAAEEQQPQQQQKPQSTYWFSERSTGSFARTFQFPQRVDVEGVTASLKNGILDVNVPKAPAPVAKRIDVN